MHNIQMQVASNSAVILIPALLAGFWVPEAGPAIGTGPLFSYGLEQNGLSSILLMVLFFTFSGCKRFKHVTVKQGPCTCRAKRYVCVRYYESELQAQLIPTHHLKPKPCHLINSPFVRCLLINDLLTLCNYYQNVISCEILKLE